MARSHEQALLRRVSFSGRWQVFRKPPRIAVLLQVNNLAASTPRCGQNASYERPKWLT
jgi:hypothetical protein